MKTIPEIRSRLHELADLHGIPELHELADETKRRYNGRKGRKKHFSISEDMAEAIRKYAAGHPDDHLSEIAVRFGTNQGRVSEVLFGKRE